MQRSEIQEICDAAKSQNPDVLCLSHGGPIANAPDAKYINGDTDTVGFVEVHPALNGSLVKRVSHWLSPRLRSEKEISCIPNLSESKERSFYENQVIFCLFDTPIHCNTIFVQQFCLGLHNVGFT